MVNPHSWFHLDIKDKDGNISTWMVEGGSPNQLIRMGVTKNTVPVGTEITVEGYQAKDGTQKAVGRNFVLADGKRLFLGGFGWWRIGPFESEVTPNSQFPTTNHFQFHSQNYESLEVGSWSGWSLGVGIWELNV